MDDEAECQVMKWYWLMGLNRIMAVEYWGDKEKWYTTISRAVFPPDPNKKLFDISTEAFLVLLWENCFDKWTAALKWLEENPGKKLPKRTKTNKNDPMFQAKYTTQDGGQQRLGGWEAEGIERYNEIYDLIGNAKYNDYLGPKQVVKPEWVKFEHDFLAKIRGEKGFTASSL